MPAQKTRTVQIPMPGIYADATKPPDNNETETGNDKGARSSRCVNSNKSLNDETQDAESKYDGNENPNLYFIQENAGTTRDLSKEEKEDVST